MAALVLALSACDAAPVKDEPSPGTGVSGDTSALPTPAGDTDPASAGQDTVSGAAWTVGTTTVDNQVEGAALLRSVRAARHDGFDRIVLDFAADEVPSYHVEYVDRPVLQCGSGEAVPLAGDAWIVIRIQPANAHTEEGQPTITQRELSPDLPTLLELKLICDFEAHVEWVAAVSSPEQYRAFTLASPNRLVVDIRHR